MTNNIYIRDWQEKLASIYPNTQLGPDYIMVHLATSTSELSRTFNQQKQGERSTDIYVLKAVSWIIALCNHFKIDFEDALVQRFPLRCSYCLRAPCECSETNKRAYSVNNDRELSSEEIERELMFLRGSLRNSGARLSFDGFKERIFSIYPANKYFVYAGYYAFPLGKLDEEKGELHKAYSSYLLGKGELEGISEEVADVLAWLLSFWSIRTRKSFDAEMSSLFSMGCPACRKAPCICPRYSITRGEEELFRDIIKGLRDFSRVHAERAGEVEELISAAKSIREVSDPAARNRVLGKIRSLVGWAKNIPALAKGTRETIENVSDAVDALGELLP